jgi:hypothetical protein
MNLDELENNRQDDQNFQDDKINKGMEIESPSTDHSITEYAEPDYGNDLSTEEINQQNPQEFDNEELDNGENTEFDNEEEFDDEAPDDLDEDDEEFTDPNRNE